MHAWSAMSLGAAGRVNQRPLLRGTLIQDMDTGIDLRPNGNGRASVLPASKKRVTADSIGCGADVRFWGDVELESCAQVHFESSSRGGAIRRVVVPWSTSQAFSQ